MTQQTTNETTERERQAFEAKFGPKDTFAWRTEDGRYKSAPIQLAWEIWQESRAALPPASGEAVDLADTLSAVLWLYHRLPRGYERQSHIERVVKALATETGSDGDFLLRELGREQEPAAPVADTGAAYHDCCDTPHLCSAANPQHIDGGKQFTVSVDLADFLSEDLKACVKTGVYSEGKREELHQAMTTAWGTVISKSAFIEAYCARSKITWQELSQQMVCLPCRCGDAECEGWQMRSKNVVDYKLLLAKYIEHVVMEEGSTFIGSLYRGSNGRWEGMSDRVDFTQEEKEALEVAEKVFCGEGKA